MRTNIIPVIHYADDDQALRNADRAFEAGCDGVLLIHMEGRNALLPPIARAIKKRWRAKPVGINLLGVDPVASVMVSLSHGLDMTWTDEQITHSDADPTEAEEVRQAMSRHAGHVLFAGVAFKHQRHEPDPSGAARRAVDLGFVPTTSGPATGVAAERESIAALRRSLGPQAPLAIASGITPGNAIEFAPLLTHVLVATGVSSSFHEFDPAALSELCAIRDAA